MLAVLWTGPGVWLQKSFGLELVGVFQGCTASLLVHSTRAGLQLVVCDDQRDIAGNFPLGSGISFADQSNHQLAFLQSALASHSSRQFKLSSIPPYPLQGLLRFSSDFASSVCKLPPRPMSPVSGLSLHDCLVFALHVARCQEQLCLYAFEGYRPE